MAFHYFYLPSGPRLTISKAAVIMPNLWYLHSDGSLPWQGQKPTVPQAFLVCLALSKNIYAHFFRYHEEKKLLLRTQTIIVIEVKMQSDLYMKPRYYLKLHYCSLPNTVLNMYHIVLNGITAFEIASSFYSYDSVSFER